MAPPPPCSVCHQTVTSKNPMLACQGSCGQSFHFTCAKIAVEVKEHLKNTPGLYWRCVNCRGAQQHTDALLSTKIERISEVFLDKLLSIKEFFQEEIKSLSQEIRRCTPTVNLQQSVSNERGDTASYSSVASTMSQSRLIVQPKIKQQSSKITKANILDKADPVKLGVRISGILPTRDGGVILGCNSVTDSEKLMSAATKELSEDYDIKLIGGMLSNVRIVGLSDNFSPENIAHYLRVQNEHLFTEKSIFHVSKVQPIRNKASIYSATLRVDTDLYHKIQNTQSMLSLVWTAAPFMMPLSLLAVTVVMSSITLPLNVH